MEKTIPVTRQDLARIYEHLGGPQNGQTNLLVILNDFYERMSKDALIGFFFSQTTKTLPEIAAKQAEFLMRAMGAIPSYTGKPPAQAHEKMAPILGGHFDRRLVILTETLRAHGLPENHVNAWIAFEKSFRDQIVK